MHSNPFPNITLGLQHGSYNTVARDYRPIGDAREVETVDRNPYKYKFNGKELEVDLGLDWYAMDMRMYDPTITRWMVQDPVVHHGMSPYNAFDNNPVYWADPSGADSQGGGDENSGDGDNSMGSADGSDMPVQNGKGGDQKGKGRRSKR
ncbi:RHS repeat-associated core domain-containing protein [Vaginella massiliensis]|uniref:RHS repeat-associated core domain-containing protein n=1 Tax=Vaginella massiliensis TaxID=1816680 RepID=UPI003750A32B